MSFAELMRRLCRVLQERVHNGELTERGFARRIGLSQSHIHNVLCGARVLTVNTADQIMEGLGMSVVDLLDPVDYRRRRPQADFWERRAG